MKKICSLLLAVILGLNLVICVSAVGDVPTPTSNDDDHNISQVDYSSYFRSIDCTSKANLYPSGTTRIVIKQTLEKKTSNNDWSYSCGWTTTVSPNSGAIINTAYNRSVGTYHLKTVFSFYNGDTFLSDDTVYSGEITIR